MRIVKLNAWSRVCGLVFLIAGCSFSSFLCSAALNSPSDQAQKVSPPAALPVDVTRLRFSPGLADIVKMVKANVDPKVILMFISHSPVAYHPSTQELIALKKLGVPNEIVIALLGHRTRPSERPQLSAQPAPALRTPATEQGPAPPWPPFGIGYQPQPYAFPVPAYPTRAFTAFGPMSSFNNSYPTFVNGRPVYAGWYLPAYAGLW